MKKAFESRKDGRDMIDENGFSAMGKWWAGANPQSLASDPS